MNDPLQRKMFREAGMSKQPMGILASSPELMSAAKGYKDGGVGSIQIPFYGQRQPKGASNQGGNNYTTIDDNLQAIQNQGLQTDFGDAFGPKENNVDVSQISIEPTVEVPGSPPSINDQNKSALDKSKLKFPQSTSLGIRGKTDEFEGEVEKEAPPTNSSFEKLKNIYGEQGVVAATNIAKGLEDADSMKFGGKTVQQLTDNLFATMNKEGKEPTLADVNDEVTALLGYDRETLDKEFDKDTKSAFFLNLMKAGLAMAAGQSSNALTNVAKGLGAGLAGYGEDVGKLNDDLRADRKEATNVAYKLLQNKRSSELAKDSVDLQKKQIMLQIGQSNVTQKKADLYKDLEIQTNNRKLKIDFLSTMAQLENKGIEMQNTKEYRDQVVENAFFNAQPDQIKAAIIGGHIIKNKDGTYKPPILTDLGKTAIGNVIADLNSSKATIYDKKVINAGSSGKISGIVIENFNKLEGDAKAVAISKIGSISQSPQFKQYNDSINDGDFGAALGTLISLAGDKDLIIDFNSLHPSIQQEIKKKPKVSALANQYDNIIANLPPLKKSKED